MSSRRNLLGRGLASILKNPKTDITSERGDLQNIVGNISNIKISDITANPFQPRTQFYEEKLEELASSIKELGIIQPITVRKLGYNKYQLISGERRLKASKIALKKEIPAYIRIANDQEMLEMSLIENIQRSSLNPIEIALSYQRLINECKLTQEQCSVRVGKKRSTVANFIGLLNLPEEIKSSLKKSEISMGIGRALINIKNKDKQLNIFYDALEHGFSVREVEQIVKEFKGSNYKRSPNKKISDRNISENTLSSYSQKMIDSLSLSLNQKVEIKRNKKGKGKLIIPFNSDEDLRNLIDTLNQKD